MVPTLWLAVGRSGQYCRTEDDEVEDLRIDHEVLREGAYMIDWSLWNFNLQILQKVHYN